jgi:protein-disulfide isomerase
LKKLIPRFPIDPYFLAGIVAILAAGLFYRAQLGATTPRAPALASLPAGFTQALDTLGAGRSEGRPGAPVHVVELFDYQCPACAAAHEKTAAAISRLVEAGSIRYTSYDLPLPNHANAIPASVVANCVADEAPAKLAAVRRRLFASQAAWEQAYPAEPALLGVIGATGVDTAAVRGCVARTGPHRAALYRKTWAASRAAGVTFTPAWSVNGKVVPWPALEEAIQATLQSSR